MSGVALGAAAITAGAGIYSASKSGGGGGSAPKPKDPLVYANKAATNLFTNYYPYAVPLALGVSEKFGPQIMGQMFDQTGQFLGGVGGQPGFQELQRTTGLQAGQTLAELRAAELGQQAGQTGFTRNLLASLSPEQAAVVQASAQEAERARASAQGVTPEERRAYEQQARETYQASGRLGGNAAVAAEIMGREDTMRRKREEAAQAGQRSYSQAGEFYTNPGLAALRSAPLSYTAGQQDLSTALSLGPASSGQFDFNAPLGFAQQRAGAENTYSQAKYATDMYNRQANAQMWQGIGSNVAGIVGSGNFGSMLGSGLSSTGNMFGSSGMYNTGAQLYNANLGAGTPPKAYIV
jgi:hypothetical protein